MNSLNPRRLSMALAYSLMVRSVENCLNKLKRTLNMDVILRKEAHKICHLASSTDAVQMVNFC